MALPKLTVMKHELILPSTGEKVTYRPFLVKEEKILMMAMQGGKASDMVKALREIIQNCVENDNVSIDTLPMFDIEYIFLQLRAKSKGEDLELEVPCGKCKAPVSFKFNLLDVNVFHTEGHENKIELTDGIGVMMKYPSITIKKT